MGMEDVVSFAARTYVELRAHDQVHLEPNQVGGEFWEPSGIALGPPVLDQNVPTLDPAALPKA